MARQTHKLSAIAVRNAKRPGLYGDGAGLYLRVGPSGAKSWVYRFMLRGKARTMGLGPLHTLSLADARDAAQAARQKVNAGIDPIADREAEAAIRAREAAPVLTFRQCAERYIAAQESAWSDDNYRAAWVSALERFAYPVIGDMAVRDVDTPAVLKVIEPLWNDRTATASRLRSMIEAVLDWATARDEREGANPAAWRGRISKILPSPAKVRPVRHHRALPYEKAPEFMAAVRAREGVAFRALEFLTLTATRSGETLGAAWEEIDTDKAIWSIPAARMKSRRPFRVPLSRPALEILDALPRVKGNRYVFPGTRQGRSLSERMLIVALDMMKWRSETTPHGLRSCFRDWAGERTAYPREIAEAALAHAIGDRTERSYARGDLFDRRARLMCDWAAYLDTGTASAEVVPIRLGKGT